MALLLILLVAAALPFALPSSVYEGQLGPTLQRMAHGNIKVGQYTFEYTPRPALVLQNVIIDNDPAVGKIDRIAVPINAYNVLNWGKALRDVEIEGGKFSPTFAISLPQRLKPEPETPRLTDLKLIKSSVVVGQGELGPVDGTVRFDQNGQLAELMITDSERHLELHIEPKEGVFALTLNASNWELPFGYPVKFDSLLLKGVGNSAGIVIEDIRADLYSGIVTGNGQLNWGDGWQLSGTVRSNGLQAEPFSQVFTKTTRSSGRLVGEANFVFKAADYPQLFDAPAIDAKLQLRDGILYNLDLVTPLKSQGSGAYHGGQTTFATVDTLLQIRPNVVQFSKTRIESGKYLAVGGLTIGAGQKLNGSFAARVNSGALVVSNQIQIAGTLDKTQFHTGAAYRPREGDAPAEPAPEAPAAQ
ncbi:hypothetical protein [Andreprevotia sp. IGB-42]|uniref:hypothetical protein n=1 Tax=Andreprevotia sp. IGB-42 TaxID=2497473 RepID=UPI00135BACEE|nr:hypothetical protein [Andreprevotia sp. IGB-42]